MLWLAVIQNKTRRLWVDARTIYFILRNSVQYLMFDLEFNHLSVGGIVVLLPFGEFLFYFFREAITNKQVQMKYCDIFQIGSYL